MKRHRRRNKARRTRRNGGGSFIAFSKSEWRKHHAHYKRLGVAKAGKEIGRKYRAR